jgi:ribonuclease R
MKERLGERFEGTVTAVVGSGVFVQLDAPFVDVLVRLEDLGGDRWEVDDDALRVVAARSGDRVSLGDRMIVEITDAAILRRTVYARRIGGDSDRANPRGPQAKRKDPRRSPKDTKRPSNNRPQPSRKGKPQKQRGPKGKKRRGR